VTPTVGTSRKPMKWAVALALALALALPGSAIGAGHTYTVVQCDPLNRARADAILEDAAAYATRAFCGDPDNDYAIKVTSTGAAHHGGSGRVRWSTGLDDLGIVSVSLEAKLRRDNGHAARLWMANPQLDEVARVATGSTDPTGYKHYTWSAGSGHGRRQFVASLSCTQSAGCPQSDLAKTWVRGVRLKVADYSDPRLTTVGGELLDPSWRRGIEGLHAVGDDAGSGLAQIYVTLNSVGLATRFDGCDVVPGTSFAARFAACNPGLTLDTQPDTAQAPFREGANQLSICIVDFAGNRVCQVHTVQVDNTAPALRFSNSQDVDDPETIRAPVSDATSGVASGQISYRPVGGTQWRPLETQLEGGEIRARINSTVDPPGPYEFRAEASDGAGNVADTTLRQDGQPMVLTFPLKSGVRLTGHLVPGGAPTETIGYGQISKVSGRLVNAAGSPLAHQEITVIEHFAEGALLNRRVRTVQTDADGLWGERLPAGPSRKVTASYAGNQRYLSGDHAIGTLHVKTRATFRLSRRRVPEGRHVVFHGRVGHLGARVPAGGKLIELQVQDGAEWHTVRQAFYTGPDGRYRMLYRFARFYRSDVAYRFRLKVLRERGWPYKAPESSRSKRLVVKAR